MFQSHVLTTTRHGRSLILSTGRLINYFIDNVVFFLCSKTFITTNIVLVNLYHCLRSEFGEDKRKPT